MTNRTHRAVFVVTATGALAVQVITDIHNARVAR
jgi:hypothetical protein